MNKEQLNINFKIDKVKYDRDLIEKNYLNISDLINNGIKNSLDENLINKLKKIQTNLDNAMNFFYSKVNLIIKSLESKEKMLSNIPKRSLNNDFISNGNIDSFNDQILFNDIRSELTASERDFFATNAIKQEPLSEFEDFEENNNKLLISNLNNEEKKLEEKKEAQKIQLSEAKILFFDEKIKEMENKLKNELERVKQTSAMTLSQTDDVMLKLHKLEEIARSGNPNSNFKDNKYFQNLNSILNSTLLKLENIEKNVANKEEKEKLLLSSDLEKLNVIKSMNIQMEELKNNVNSLSSENAEYKQKIEKYVSDIKKLREKINSSEEYINKTNKNFINNSHKLEDLEKIFSSQILEYEELSKERSELIEGLEGKIYLLKNKLKNNENEFEIFKSKLQDQFALLEKQYSDALLEKTNSISFENKNENMDSMFVDKGLFAKENSKIDHNEKENIEKINEGIKKLEEQSSNENAEPITLPYVSENNYYDAFEKNNHKDESFLDENSFSNNNLRTSNQSLDDAKFNLILKKFEDLSDNVLTKNDLETFKDNIFTNELEIISQKISDLKKDTGNEFIKIQNDLLETNKKINNALTNNDFSNQQDFQEEKNNDVTFKREEIDDNIENLDKDKKSDNKEINYIINDSNKTNIFQDPESQNVKFMENIEKLREVEKVLIDLNFELEKNLINDF